MRWVSGVGDDNIVETYRAQHERTLQETIVGIGGLENVFWKTTDWLFFLFVRERSSLSGGKTGQGSEDSTCVLICSICQI